MSLDITDRLYTHEEVLKIIQEARKETVAEYTLAQELRTLEAHVEEIQKSNDTKEIICRLTSAMQDADLIFDEVGGGTRHYVRECLLPMLEKHGLEITTKEANPERIDKAVTI